jgi:hypothetical protein
VNIKNKATSPVEMHAKQTAIGPETAIYKQRNPVMKREDPTLSKLSALSNISV